MLVKPYLSLLYYRPVGHLEGRPAKSAGGQYFSVGNEAGHLPSRGPLPVGQARAGLM